MGRLSTASSRRIHVFVQGGVQGVSFRAYTVDKALTLGLTGWVRNRSDGRVEVVAEGYQEELEQLLKWLHSGSPSADVAGVESEWLAATGEFVSFDRLWTE